MQNEIRSANFLLRRPTLSDFSNMRKLESDEDVVRYTSYRCIQSDEQTLARLEANIAKATEREPLGIWLAESCTQDFIGWFMLIKTDAPHPELGLMILKKYWGMGYSTEIAGAILKHASTNLGIKQISARVSPNNPSSLRVLEKLGFYVQETIFGKDGESLILLEWIEDQ